MQKSYQIALLLGIFLSVYYEIIPKKYIKRFGGYIMIGWLFFGLYVVKHHIDSELNTITEFVITFGIFLISAFMCAVIISIIKKLTKPQGI
ncbi:MAG: hypothetical protein Q3971_01630 [Moraxella sp.]|nr:hypothetical protein [Moraxella sp.]